MQKAITTILVSLILSVSASAQSLDKLADRAKHLLDLRVSGNKYDAVRYIEGNSRNDFLVRSAPPISDAHIVGLEFSDNPKSDNPKMVYVVVKATFLVRDVGPFPATVREPWIWDGKDWFLRLPPPGSPFDLAKNAPPVPPVQPIPFELNVKNVDFGKHVQGEILTRSISFKSDQDLLLVIRPSDLPGLTVTGPVWTSKDTGQLEVTLDTALLSDKIDYSVNFEAVGLQQQKANSTLHLAAEVDTRLRFSQNPEMIDPSKPGTATVRIENVSKTPLKLLNIILTNPAYKPAEDFSDSIAAGGSWDLTITYGAQPTPTGATLHITTSPALLAGNATVVLPLHINFPATTVPTYTKEQLDEVIKRSR